MPPWGLEGVFFFFFSSSSLGPIDATTWWTDIGSFRISDCWSICWLPVVSAWTTGKHGLCCQLVSDSLLNSPPCLPLINTNYNLLLSNYHSITSLTSCYGVITSRGLWVNESVQRLDKAHYYTYYNNSWWAYQYFASGRNLKLRKARQSWSDAEGNTWAEHFQFSVLVSLRWPAGAVASVRTDNNFHSWKIACLQILIWTDDPIESEKGFISLFSLVLTKAPVTNSEHGSSAIYLSHQQKSRSLADLKRPLQTASLLPLCTMVQGCRVSIDCDTQR